MHYRIINLPPLFETPPEGEGGMAEPPPVYLVMSMDNEPVAHF